MSTIIIEEWLPKQNQLLDNQKLSAQIMSIPFIISTILFPFVGLYVDKYGNRLYLLNLAVTISLIIFLYFFFKGFAQYRWLLSHAEFVILHSFFHFARNVLLTFWRHSLAKCIFFDIAGTSGYIIIYSVYLLFCAVLRGRGWVC